MEEFASSGWEREKVSSELSAERRDETKKEANLLGLDSVALHHWSEGHLSCRPSEKVSSRSPAFRSPASSARLGSP